MRAVDTFDPDRGAVVFGVFLGESPTFAGRPVVAHRRPAWLALEDKLRLADVLDRAGVTAAPSTVVPIAAAGAARHDLDVGAGTVWAADATQGFHGAGALTRWVTGDDRAAEVTAELAPHCRAVRIMPFLDGVATSIHGLVLPDGVAVLRPVELVTLRQGHDLRYSGCATFWDPPATIRDEMRAAARAVGDVLRRDVDFRGAFTLDGVATADGFRPTELNPRFGAGLSVITRGLDGVPLPLVLDLVVAGRPLAISRRRSGGRTARRRRRGAQRRHMAAARPDGARDRRRPRLLRRHRLALGHRRRGGRRHRRRRPGLRPGPVRRGAHPGRPVGGTGAAAFWRFADHALGTAIGPLTAPLDVARPASAETSMA